MEFTAIAIKNGRMENGELFCAIGDQYRCRLVEGEDSYMVEDEIDKLEDFDLLTHHMHREFFYEHFKVDRDAILDAEV